MQKLLTGKNILFAPLNWGLGHATRSIPIIQKLLEEGARVTIAGDGESFEFLKEAFPGLNSQELPSYNIEYPTGWGGAWKTVFKARDIIKTIKAEHEVVEQLAQELQLDYIFSDNRYGVYSEKTPSVFIGHQLKVLPPKGFQWGSGVILAWQKSFLKKFSEVWVPDFPEENNLSGRLSHGVNVGIPVRFIGPQSRFYTYNRIDKVETNPENPKIVAVLSGPEPQRTFLEKILLEQFETLEERTILIRGTVQEGLPVQNGQVEIINYLHGKELYKILKQAKLVICRPGYSTLMDLSLLGKKLLLIPTPGQTEQEYLAKELSNDKRAVMQKQSQVNIKKALENMNSVREWSGTDYDETLLPSVLKQLIDCGLNNKQS